MRYVLRSAVVVLFVLCSGAKAGPAVSRVFDTPAASGDERLRVSHDVDNPWPFEPHYTAVEQWAVRQQEIREQVMVAEGLWPMPERTPLNPIIHGRIEREGYTVEKVFFASMPGHYVSGSLYRPTGKSGKLPAVLSPHGHWPGGRFYENGEKEARQQIEKGAEKTMEGARFPIQARCAMLARMGCVVFQYDMIGYADSQAIVHREGFNDVEAALRLQSFMGLQSWNSVRALDFITALPDVDPKRVAVTGASGGGTQTLVLCAIDPRPAVSFPAVMVSESMQGGCICENAPLLRVGLNNAELAASFAPKPLGMTAANDWTLELETRGLPQIKAIYKLYGAADKAMAWHRPFEHNYNQVSRELMYNWMNKHLALGLAEPVTEQPFVPVPPKELSVYDAEHPLPADSTDAATLRKAMTAGSDAQVVALAKEPSEYRRVIGTALRAIVGDKLPGRGEVLVGDSRGPKASDGLTIEKGTIQRRGGGSRVPYVAITPADWNGTVVVWAHPEGKVSLFDAQEKPSPLVQKLLDGKSAVLAPDLFLTGELLGPAGVPQPGSAKYAGFTFAGYRYGYNPALLASRTSDVLSAIALAREWEGVKAVRLVGFGKAGIAALLARGLAGDAVDRAALDLDHFDFEQVKDANGEMMLPGAIKYGGVWGIVPLCSSGSTALWNAPETPRPELVAKTTKVQIVEGKGEAAAMLTWLLRDGTNQ
ncbi:MAG: hypothetical protein JWL69_2178 [Phycisphaerales bacterium]|nr:hypothetical protein [Phycisphaerales bacterium]